MIILNETRLNMNELEKENKISMKMITIFFPEQVLESINLLVKKKLFANRSELIRVAVYSFITDMEKIMNFYNILNDINDINKENIKTKEEIKEKTENDISKENIKTKEKIKEKIEKNINFYEKNENINAEDFEKLFKEQLL